MDQVSDSSIAKNNATEEKVLNLISVLEDIALQNLLCLE